MLRSLKTKTGKEKWQKKPLDKKLLAWADDLKKSLTAFQFCCYQFDEATVKGKKGPRRVLKGCHLNGLVMLDIDHVDNPMEVWEKLQKCEQLMARVVLVHITSSGHGIRIIFIADRQIGNLADQQISFAAVLGYAPDQSCIDATRNSFAPKEDEILFIDENRLFTYYDEEFDKEYTPMYRDKKTQPLHHQFDADNSAAGTNRSVSAAVAGKDDDQGSEDGGQVDAESVPIMWRGYDIQRIIDARYAAKLPCEADSNRHNESLKLATDLMLMLDKDKAKVQRVVESQPWVQEIIDERNEDVSQTVESAASCIAEKEKKYVSSLPSKAMLSAIQEACGKTYQEITKAQTAAVTLKDDDMARWLWEWGAEIEALAEEYPLIMDICKGLKRNQYPAALFVAGGLMMTLMTRCTYRFYHRPEELRRLNNSTLIIGDPASGKSFATRLFKLLASPIVEADKIGKDAINAYREQMRTKGANKEKPKKPKVVVRIHPARTSNAQFIQDMVNAVEEVNGEPMQLHMLTFDTELDNTLSLQKGGSYIDKQALQLKAFHNEEDGQAYSNVDSVFQEFYVIWNYIYTGTPIALKKMVNEQNFGSGLATRLTCIPLPATNFEMMSRESFVDYDSDERLKAWAEKLDKMKGELSVQKIVDELYDWTARRMEDAKENDSKADEMLLKRCAYHGLNFSAPFIVMRHWDKMKQDGQYWCGEFETDEVDWKLAELIVNIQYACQRHYFGAMAENYFDNKLKDASVNVQRKQKTFEAFSRLPEEFTNEDVMRCFNLSSASSARGKVSRLMRDHLVEKIREERGTAPALYQKTGSILL
ncbi:MAG: hypothetical protein E7102_12910 [Prevotella ruminicola]|uniref:BT4734-like N-terminal domain-containing protein n=1 Tax=Xylanibacter ruminicola TaxID=839 RepID=A0A928BUQ8_XYLRU|nr:hypothetical protein [Xylanibacter ruminicola]